MVTINLSRQLLSLDRLRPRRLQLRSGRVSVGRLVTQRWLNLLGLLACSCLAGAQQATVTADECSWLGLGSPQVSSDVVWTDWIIDGQWRIQRHAIIGHYRLLNPQEQRLAFGSLPQCFAELERRRAAGELPPMSPRVVVVIHGFRSNRRSLAELSEYLAQHTGATIVNFGYASTIGTVQDHAWALESVLRNLNQVQQVQLVAHSMGNLLVRHLVYKLRAQAAPLPLTLERMVMISPPNHGSQLAEAVERWPLLDLAFGETLAQLSPDLGWPALERQLATPDFEFGIIAGGRGNETGYSLRIAGDDDGVLSMETQQLEGATDFLQTGGLHQSMPRYVEVQSATVRFLEQGAF